MEDIISWVMDRPTLLSRRNKTENGVAMELDVIELPAANTNSINAWIYTCK